jgi:hypothetical protein
MIALRFANATGFQGLGLYLFHDAEARQVSLEI